MNPIDVLYLVEDDYMSQFLASEVIKSTNMVQTLKIFSNGSEAIEFLKKSKNNPEELPDVIFLDIFMPVMDGWGFLDEFKSIKLEMSKKIQILLVTSSIDPLDMQRANSISEVSDFVIKPITRPKFLNLLESITKR